MAFDINLGRLAAYVRLDFSKLKGDEDKAKKSIKDFSAKLTKEVGASFTDLGARMSAGITAPLLLLGKAAVGAAKDFDSLKRGLTAVAGSTAEAERQMKRLKEVAKLPGLSFEQAVEGSTRLQAAGFSAQIAERSLKAFGNALATVGKGSAELEGVNLALSQIASKGKVSAEEINQIAERVPQIRQIMLRVFGTADTEVIQKAKITSQQFVQAIVGELEKLPKVTGGVANSFENFSDTMRASLAEVGKAILPDLTKAMKDLEEGVKTFVGWWTKLPEETRQNIVRFVEIAGVIGPVIFAVGSLAKAFDALKLATAFLRTPGGLIGAGFAVAGLAIVKVTNDLNNAIEQGRDAVGKASGKILAQREKNPTYNLNILKGLKEERAKIERALKEETFSPALTARRQRDLEALNKLIHAREGQAQGNWKDMGPPAPSPQEQLQSALQKQLRAQIAAGAKESADKKAETARRKAEAESRRKQAAADRRQALEDRVIGKAGQFSKNAYDVYFQDLIDEAKLEAQNKRILGEMTSAEMGSTFTSKMQEQAEEIGARWALEEEKAKAKFRKRIAAGASFMGGASDAFSAALGGLSPAAQKLAEVTAQKQMQLEDRVALHATQMGRMGLAEYQQYLQKRLLDARGTIEEQMRIETELADVTSRLMEQQERKRFQGWQNLARGMEGVFANAFENVLSGSKDFFQSLLDGFKQMLAQMLAQAIAAGLMRALFGGGSFITGFLGAFGFDSGANDAKMYRWARDASRHAAAGSRDFQRNAVQQGRAALAGGAMNVNVNMGGVTINHPMDFRQVEEQLGQATRRALRRIV